LIDDALMRKCDELCGPKIRALADLPAKWHTAARTRGTTMRPFHADRRLFLAGATAAVLLPSAGVAAPLKGSPHLKRSPDGRFVRDTALDIGGYFLPLTDIKAGTFRLECFMIDTPKDFESFEKTGATTSKTTPFLAAFEDLSSPEKQGDQGPYRANSPRVQSIRYVITRDRIEFVGLDPQIGAVHFTGMPDPMFLAGKSRQGGADLTGDLVIGDSAFRDLGFSYSVGD
jgi:hypothetical protein